MIFRTLNADEIECRVATVSDKGCSLLLYKDARADMNLLDETVGSEKWQRKHELINGNLFCNVGIKIGDDWIWKQDVGTESYTEAEKGQASDSFKRACVNWGIGRELYTSPFIWINAGDVNIAERNGKKTTYDRFKVKHIAYDERRSICGLMIVNEKTNKTVFNMASEKAPAPKSAKNPEKESEALTGAKARAKILAYLNKSGKGPEFIQKLCEGYGVTDLKDLSLAQANHYIDFLRKKGLIDE